MFKVVAKMSFYDTVFNTFDNIPTVQFIVIFTLLYSALFPVLHVVLSLVPRYAGFDERRQSYVRSKLGEVAVFIFLVSMGVCALAREDINLWDTGRHKQNPQVNADFLLVNIVMRHMILSSDRSESSGVT